MGRHAYLITAYDDYYLLDCLMALHKREWTRGLNPPASSRHLAM